VSQHRIDGFGVPIFRARIVGISSSIEIERARVTSGLNQHRLLLSQYSSRTSIEFLRLLQPAI
jgi:hypothetical protein